MRVEVSKTADIYQDSIAKINEIRFSFQKEASVFPNEDKERLMSDYGSKVWEIIRNYYETVKLRKEPRDIVKIRFGKKEYDAFDAHIKIGAIYYAGAPRPAVKQHADKLWFQYGEEILAEVAKSVLFSPLDTSNRA